MERDVIHGWTIADTGDLIRCSKPGRGHIWFQMEADGRMYQTDSSGVPFRAAMPIPPAVRNRVAIMFKSRSA